MTHHKQQLWLALQRQHHQQTTLGTHCARPKITSNGSALIQASSAPSASAPHSSGARPSLCGAGAIAIAFGVNCNFGRRHNRISVKIVLAP